MAWRIVKQPNGLYGRFSDIVDNFTVMNMTEQEAIAECEAVCGKLEAARKVMAAREDWPPYTIGVIGSGLDRWSDSMQRIQSVHGRKEARKIYRLGISKAED